MAALRTSLVKPRHAYTSTAIPWSMDVDASMGGTGATVENLGRWRLFHYLSGGGMRAFGRPSGQELLLHRQRRFLWLAALLGAVWLAFSFV